jgi:hypothetical protein
MAVVPALLATPSAAVALYLNRYSPTWGGRSISSFESIFAASSIENRRNATGEITFLFFVNLEATVAQELI